MQKWRKNRQETSFTSECNCQSILSRTQNRLHYVTLYSLQMPQPDEGEITLLSKLHCKIPISHCKPTIYITFHFHYHLGVKCWYQKLFGRRKEYELNFPWNKKWKNLIEIKFFKMFFHGGEFLKLWNNQDVLKPYMVFIQINIQCSSTRGKIHSLKIAESV